MVVTSAGTPVPSGAVVALGAAVVVTMPRPALVLVKIVGPTVVLVVTTLGAAVDVVVEAGGDVVCGTVVIGGWGSVDVDPPWPLVVVDVACPPLPGGAVVYGGKVPGSLKLMSRG